MVNTINDGSSPIKHGKSLLVTILAIVVTATVVGGLVYWYMSEGAKTEKASLEGQLNSLQLQMHQLETTRTSSSGVTNNTTSEIFDTAVTLTDLNMIVHYPSTLGTADIKANGVETGASTRITFSAESDVFMNYSTTDSSAGREGSIDETLNYRGTKTISSCNELSEYKNCSAGTTTSGYTYFIFDAPTSLDENGPYATTALVLTGNTAKPFLSIYSRDETNGTAQMIKDMAKEIDRVEQ